jgi:NADPH:quinone reductase-like Zn-dependent oxidoreductase
MKAIVQDRYGSADVLELRDIEEPVVGESDVLVRVHAAGAGPDVWHFMTGQPYMARPVIGFRGPKERSGVGTSPERSRRSARKSQGSNPATR